MAEIEQASSDSVEIPEINETEQLYQCPSCNAYVEETSERCECGVIFEKEDEVYLCPGCAHQVAQDARDCPNCGMLFE